MWRHTRGMEDNITSNFRKGQKLWTGLEIDFDHIFGVCSLNAKWLYRI